MTQETLIKVIAATLVAKGCNETTQANWCFDFDEIEDMFELKEGTVEKIIKDIDNEVCNYVGVAETEILFQDKSYSISFYTSYCGCDYLLEEN